ncbi:MAG TPA: OB-fold nucleic acid binding domain-containing protein [Mycobacteriales bacterium]|nr:OB-fold nucleic acid binding domain-containing protein [Mycobacteriales bacterium]
MSDRSRPARPTLWQRALHRLTADERTIEAEELRSQAERAGATPIERCGDREKVCVTGVLRTVTLRPRAGVPALEAELYDGSGSLDLVWLGRRRIAGIEPGRPVRAVGRVLVSEGRRLIFNPEYELQPMGKE